LSGTPYWWDSGGSLLHTTDGGTTWTGVRATLPGSVYGIRAMEFADASEGWLLAETQYGVLLLHTIDGGAHWGAISIDDAWDLRAMYFSGHTDGWIVGGYDTILATTDGGGMAPITASNSGRSSRWTNKSFTLRFKTTDDGYGLAPTQSRLGDGPWEDRASRVIAAPSNHSNDGIHLVHYRGVDLAGNHEKAHSALVVVDTRRPTLDARGHAKARAWRVATLRMKSKDTLSPTVRVRAVAYTLSGKRVRVLRGSLRADGVWHSVRYGCILKPGAYRLTVQVSDWAGNKAPKAETILLRVVR
jgi:hypothetical protein